MMNFLNAFNCHLVTVYIFNQKKKEKVFTIEIKLEIINQLEKGVSDSSPAVIYNNRKATVSDKKSRKKQFFNMQLT